jgi:dienelactone hydrolase
VNINSDFGQVRVSTVKIDSDYGKLNGLLYQPGDFVKNRVYPAVVIAHGISESAEMMSSLGLELSRNGFVVFCVDLPGHGGSDGTIDQIVDDSTLGVRAVIDYLSNQSYVNSSQIGLIGHSLGAGAVRVANAKSSSVQATILIGGGVGAAAQGAQYGELNATFPKNVLIIIGQYDVLFNISQLTSTDLLALFNSKDPILIGEVYGDFKSQTAREIITPVTTHLFESIDPTVVTESVNWMKNALASIDSEVGSSKDQIYPVREIALVSALALLLAVILMAYFPVASLLRFKPNESSFLEQRSGKKWKSYLVWGALNLTLFFPMVALGLVIHVPPLIFGSSIAWWLLVSGLLGLLILSKTRLGSSFDNLSLVQTVRQSLLAKKDVLIALCLFLLFLFIVSSLQTFDVKLKMVAPIFQGFASLRQVFAFLLFLPFFITYFIVEQLFLLKDEFRQRGTVDYLEIVFVKISPFVMLLGINFLPKVIFGIWIIPSFAGFIIEFLWLMIPIFVITAVSTLWFFRRTHNLATGALFNTLVLAWIAATVFPF